MLLQRIGNQGLRLGTLFDRAAHRHPANIMIIDHDLDVAPELGRRVTLTEIANLVDDFASRLWAARVRPADRVAIYKSNNFDITLLACAIVRIGAVPMLLSPKLDGTTVVELLHRADRPYLVTDQIKLEDISPTSVFDVAEHVLLTTGSYPRATELQSLAGAKRVAAVTMSPDHPTLITHTSGTTGTPKLAVHTGRAFAARYRPQASVAALVGKHETVAIHVSFVHSRIFTAMPIPVLQGHQVIILANDDPMHIGNIFTQVPPGLIETHPNSFIRWEELADDPRKPLANVKYYTSTFDAIHPRTIHRLLHASRRRAPLFAHLYGQSEVGPIAGRAYFKKRKPETETRCIGFPFFGMTDVRVISRDGNPPSKSSPGDIEVRSDGQIVTYLGEHERYEKQTNDGWWRMGDVGYRTKWGCLHILDRAVDAIPGIDSILAVEDALFARIDELIEVVIVPDEHGVAVPVVCTRDNKPLDHIAWKAAVTDLPAMADPVQWRLEDLPQTATTKIKRLELAKLLSARASRTSSSASASTASE